MSAGEAFTAAFAPDYDERPRLREFHEYDGRLGRPLRAATDPLQVDLITLIQA
jgi:hypothetical protein